MALPVEAVDQAVTFLLQHVPKEGEPCNLTNTREDGLDETIVQRRRLDQDIKRLEVVLAATQRRLHTWISIHRRGQNTLTPIHRLPTELLMQIFSSAVERGPKGREYLFRVGQIAEVCKAWRTLVEGTPSFWTQVSSENPPSIIQKALALSKDYPLTIDCEPKSSIPTIKTLLREAGRWRSATMELRNYEGLTRDFATPAPLLEQIKLTTLENPSAFQLNLFGGYAPVLKDITLYAVPIHWSSAALTGLHTLHIQNIPRAGPTLRQLLYVIALSPNLATLTLRNVRFTHEAIQQPFPIIPTQLRKLDLDIPAPYATALIRFLQLPPTAEVRFKVGSYLHEYQNPAPTDLDPLLPSLYASIARAEKLSINVLSSSFRASTKDFYLEIDDTLEIPRFLRWLNSKLEEGLNTYPIHLSLSSGGLFEDHALLHWLGRVSNVHTVYINASPTANAIFRYLSQPVAIDGVWRWPLPQLEVLDVGVKIRPDVLLTMVKARHTQVSLTSLKISKYTQFNSQINAQLEDIVEQMEWSRPTPIRKYYDELDAYGPEEYPDYSWEPYVHQGPESWDGSEVGTMDGEENDWF